MMFKYIRDALKGKYYMKDAIELQVKSSTERVIKIIRFLLGAIIVIIAPTILLPCIMMIIKIGMNLSKQYLNSNLIFMELVLEPISIQNYIWYYVTLIGGISAFIVGYMMYNLTKRIEINNNVKQTLNEIKKEVNSKIEKEEKERKDVFESFKKNKDSQRDKVEFSMVNQEIERLNNRIKRLEEELKNRGV